MRNNNDVFKENSYLFSSNAAFVEEMYQKYQTNPQSVDAEWQEFFANNRGGDDRITGDTAWKKYSNKVIGVSHETFVDKPKSKPDVQANKSDELSVRVDLMIDAFRAKGHFLADIDPIGLEQRISPEQVGLSLSSFGIGQEDLDKEVSLRIGFNGFQKGKVGGFISLVENTYCNKAAYEFMYMDDKEERQWLSERIESFDLDQEITSEERVEKLKTLLRIESFEQNPAR